MKLFHWEKMESLSRYANGDLIVMAETLEAARDIARLNIRHYLETDESAPRHYLFELYRTFDNLDEDDKQTILDIEAAFEKDIQRHPTIRENRPIVFIQGSE